MARIVLCFWSDGVEVFYAGEDKHAGVRNNRRDNPGFHYRGQIYGDDDIDAHTENYIMIAMKITSTIS